MNAFFAETTTNWILWHLPAWLLPFLFLHLFRIINTAIRYYLTFLPSLEHACPPMHALLLFE
jgi:hypothetical protein